MDGCSVSKSLAENQKPGYSENSAGGGADVVELIDTAQFLAIPPFPRARVQSFAIVDSCERTDSELVDLVRRHRVGGTYWATQPRLPVQYVVVRTAAAISALRNASEPLVLWTGGEAPPDNAASVVATGACDPWHMLSGATMLVASQEDEVSLIASVLGVPVKLFDAETGSLHPLAPDTATEFFKALSKNLYRNPFTNEPMSAREAVELCGFWRRMIDSNRDLAGGLGFAFWKQDQISLLLWGGSEPLRFLRNSHQARADGPVAVWRAKASVEALSALQRAEVPLIEVEDGFLRSQGLGADCVPPLSITVDRLGAYFDPARPSELEQLLQAGEFDAALLRRARRLAKLIVHAGLGKYERADAPAMARPAGERRHILVPGQVEDDRAVQTGGCGLVSNLELLKRVRAEAPGAYILYKPHPDILAGHRRGAITERDCLRYADAIVTDAPISSLIAMVDEVHVNTSLAGFEALMRRKQVTTYGVPFYAGWGLTRDLGPVPPRRTARRSLDELVAATLLVYPRYLDPVTGLPCPAEVVVDHLSSGPSRHSGLIVIMRRLQGKLMRAFGSVVQ